METGVYFYKESNSRSIRLVVDREWLLIRRDYKMYSNWSVTSRYTKLTPPILGVWENESD